MRRFPRPLLTVALFVAAFLAGVWLEFRHHLVVELVLWENRRFHAEAVSGSLGIEPIVERPGLAVLHASVAVRFAMRDAYDAYVSLPETFVVAGAAVGEADPARPGYRRYPLRASTHRYRDILGEGRLVLAAPEKDLGSAPAHLDLEIGGKVRTVAETRIASHGGRIAADALTGEQR